MLEVTERHLLKDPYFIMLMFLCRQKRVSDQRLAELETYMALRKMAGKLVTVPLGFGQVDPAKM